MSKVDSLQMQNLYFLKNSPQNLPLVREAGIQDGDGRAGF